MSNQEVRKDYYQWARELFDGLYGESLFKFDHRDWYGYYPFQVVQFLAFLVHRELG